MRISARQAWHDCYYIPRDDALARLREFVASGAAHVNRGAVVKQAGGLYVKVWVESDETLPSGKPAKVSAMIPVMSATETAKSGRDFFMMWDPIWRGKVQAAIKSLPPILRAFGMIMYAPTGAASAEQVEQVQDAIKLAYYTSLGEQDLSKWQAVRFERVNYLVLAAMYFYRRWVFGDMAAVARPREIDLYLYQQYGIRIPHLVKNWDRDWSETWGAIVAVIDTMERETLVPVGRAIAEFSQREAA